MADEPFSECMLHAKSNKIDSAAAGLNVVEVSGDINGVDLAVFEREVLGPLQPKVAFFPVKAEAVAAINHLESLGFEFAELQLQLMHRLRPVPEAERYPYHFEEAQSEADRARALELAGAIFAHDRFTTDPRFGRQVSGQRYQAYVHQSFQAPDERVFVMKNTKSQEVASFATIRDLGSGNIRLLLGGVANELKNSGVGVIHDYVGLHAYYQLGYRHLSTAVSAINHPIINLEIRHLGFRVTGSRLVLRKWYA
jgi:hypothetical protein